MSSYASRGVQYPAVNGPSLHSQRPGEESETHHNLQREQASNGIGSVRVGWQNGGVGRIHTPNGSLSSSSSVYETSTHSTEFIPQSRSPPPIQASHSSIQETQSSSQWFRKPASPPPYFHHHHTGGYEQPPQSPAHPVVHYSLNEDTHDSLDFYDAKDADETVNHLIDRGEEPNHIAPSRHGSNLEKTSLFSRNPDSIQWVFKRPEDDRGQVHSGFRHRGTVDQPVTDIDAFSSSAYRRLPPHYNRVAPPSPPAIVPTPHSTPSRSSSQTSSSKERGRPWSKWVLLLLLLLFVALIATFINHFVLNKRIRTLLQLRGKGPRRRGTGELWRGSKTDTEQVEDNDGDGDDDGDGELVWVAETGWTRTKTRKSRTDHSAAASVMSVSADSQLNNSTVPAVTAQEEIVTPLDDPIVIRAQEYLKWLGPHLEPIMSEESKDPKPTAEEELPHVYQKAFTSAWRFRSELRKYFPAQEEDSNPDVSTNIVVNVVGQSNIIKRDLPLIRKGYESATVLKMLQFRLPDNGVAKPQQQLSPSPDETSEEVWEGGESDRISITSSKNSLNDDGEEPVRSLKGQGNEGDEEEMMNLDLVLCLSLATCAGKDDDHSTLLENNPGARVNRVPNLRQVLWSKQNFCRNIPKRLAEQISFPCWVIPDDERELLDVARDFPKEQKWIAKPWSSGGGHGISVVEGGFDALRSFLLGSARRKLVVQPFMDHPLLIRNRKVDLRVYVLMTSSSPLRAYVHKRGLVRFASQEYGATLPPSPVDPLALSSISSRKRQGGSDGSRTQFLTNTSINKKDGNITAAELTWPFQQLWEELGEERSARVRLGMDRAIALLLLAVETKFRSVSGSGCDSQDGACYHLLGFDVMLASDASAAPKIIEVNGEPSFARATSATTDKQEQVHYDETKIKVARDIAQIVFAPLKFRDVETQARKLTASLPEELAERGADKLIGSLIEVSREHSVLEMTEFRPCYPSAIAAVYPSQNVDVFEDLITSTWAKASPSYAEARLALHRVLNIWMRERLRKYFKEHQDHLYAVEDDHANQESNGNSGWDALMKDVRLVSEWPTVMG